MPFEEATEEQHEGVRRMKERLSGFETEVGRLKGLDFKPRPTDVFIVTSPKSGTTWTQHIVHGLRSRGSMDFQEISEVVPWIELAYDCGQDLESEQRFAPPRTFKSHCWYPHCPKGAKYVIVVRNPMEVAISFYKFFQDWFFFEDDNVDVDTFVKEFVLQRGIPASPMNNASLWHHLTSWWPHRNDETVLWLYYEDLKDDLPACVHKIAEFMGLEYDEERERIVVSQSSISFMKEHEHKFNEALTKKHRNGPCGLPEGAGCSGSKVSTGGRHGIALRAETAEQMEKKWADIVQPVTGFASYSEMLNATSFLRVPQ
mmetsp:Transcript_2002/g.7156  ORF Transcript_2002/g.7156 Transcript_2002/m.7156 type:complete len:315 (+) Transcript_2002:35-979(+)